MNKQKKKQIAGFTLMEALITTIVLVSLMAMSIPKFYSVMRKISNQEANNILLALYLEQMKFAKENNAFCANLGQLDVEIPAPEKFNNIPNAAALHGTITCSGNTVAYLASIGSVDGNYTLYVLADGTLACTPCPSTICSNMGFDDLAGKTAPCANNGDCDTGSTCVVPPGVCVN